MLKRDFIMVQIEQLAKIVLQIVNHRDTNDTGRIPELIETVYSSLKLDHQQLMTSDPTQLIEQLNQEVLLPPHWRFSLRHFHFPS